MLMNMEAAIRNLYFHIPFCAKLCPYCSFYVDTHFINKSTHFLDALLLELDMHRSRFTLKPQTIYFGGGTPSALSLSQLEYLITGLRKRVDLGDLKEWTVEVNPATVSQEKARLLRDLGVNRISMGVQSWDDAVLKTLGRIHTARQSEKTYSILREAGFDNINLDLMFAVPGQTRETWRETLKTTIALRPEHISAYSLTYEEDTAFFKKLQTGELSRDNEWDADLFELTMDRLCEAGYGQYEVSNYAKPGCESQHNSACWNGDDYLGLGPSAFSTRGIDRWQNLADTSGFVERMHSNQSPVSFKERISPKTRLGERIAFSMRTRQGVELDLLEPWRGELDAFFALGLIEYTGSHAVLTRKGKMLADSVAEIFV